MKGSILLIGSSGYVGSSIKKYLSYKFDTITSHRGGNQKFVINEKICDDIPPEVSTIIFACGSTELQNNSWRNSYNSSVLTVCNLLDSIKRTGRSNIKLIYLSTFQVYGSYEGLISEETIPKPASPYSLSHYHAEDILRKFHNSFEIDLIILRPSNIYGVSDSSFPSRRSTLVPNCFVESAFNNQIIEVKATKPTFRDFIHIKDLCSCIELLLESRLEGQTKLYNVCSGYARDIAECAMITAKSYKKLVSKQLTLKIPDYSSHKFDNDNVLKISSKITNDIEWSPLFSKDFELSVEEIIHA